MADFTVTVDEDIIDVLEAMAKLRGVTVEKVLSDMLVENLERIKTRMNDPIIGMFESGEGDISERVEEILRNEWHPD